MYIHSNINRIRAIYFYMCALLLFPSTVFVATKSLRIIGGRDSLENEFPYVVRLEYQFTYVLENTPITKNIMFCSGSVLTASWTLTAEHCMGESRIMLSLNMHTLNPLNRKTDKTNVKLQPMVRYGSPTGQPGEHDKFSNIISTEKPPIKRSGLFSADDVMLLKTERIMLKVYAKISAVDFPTLYGQEVEVLGYGMTNTSDGKLFETLSLNKPLQALKAMVNKCEITSKLYPYMCVVRSCRGAASICGGDSGGPVLHPSGIVAVNSKAPTPLNCQMKNDIVRAIEFGILTPLSPYLDWICNQISGAKNN